MGVNFYLGDSGKEEKERKKRLFMAFEWLNIALTEMLNVTITPLGKHLYSFKLLCNPSIFNHLHVLVLYCSSYIKLSLNFALLMSLRKGYCLCCIQLTTKLACIPFFFKTRE